MNQEDKEYFETLLEKQLVEYKAENEAALTQYKEENKTALTEYKVENNRIVAEIKEDNERHMGVLVEHFESQVSAVAEQYGDIKETLDLHTEMLTANQEILLEHDRAIKELQSTRR